MMEAPSNKAKGDMTCREAGRKGGEVTRDRHGAEHYEKIGKKGGQRTKELLATGKALESEE